MVGIWNADMDLHLVSEVWIWILNFGHGIRTWDLEKSNPGFGFEFGFQFLIWNLGFENRIWNVGS